MSPVRMRNCGSVTADYFRVLRTPLLRGRFFSKGDNVDAPGVAIINDALAKKYWLNEDALGKRITFSDTRKPDVKWLTIVGIVRSIRHRGLDVDPAPEYYLPLAQRPQSSMILAVRSVQDSRGLASAIRREIQSIDPDQPIANVRTLENVTADSVAPRRMSMVLLGAFAGIAVAARRRWNLRSDFLSGRAADARNWRAHGARRATE